jgi:oligosaccharide repeat unit polymerase
MFVVSKIASRQRDSVLFVIGVFYIFYAIPIFLDLTIGLPSFYSWKGFFVSSRDETTTIIYCLFIAVIPPFLWMTRYRTVNIQPMGIDLSSFVNRYKSTIVPLLFIFLINPIFVWMFSPDPHKYFIFGPSEVRGFTEVDAAYSVYMTISVLVSIFSAFLLFQIKNKELFLFFTIALLPFLFLSVWLQGKRFSIFLVFALFLYGLWEKRVLKKSSFILVSILSTIILVAISNIYMSNTRALSYENPETRYEVSRIDFGRDGVTKMAIYAELNPNNVTILEHRGQSLLFNTFMFVPRKIWSEKPFPYPAYMTSAVFLVPPTFWSWGVTTGILDASIADFGWLGMLIGPLFITWICRIGDKQGNGIVNLLTILVASLFLVLHLPAFLPVFGIWVLSLMFVNKKSKSIKMVYIPKQQED